MKSGTAKASVMFVFITVLIDAIGLGVLIPVLPDVMRRFYQDPTAISEHFGYFIGLYALMQFVASPVLGSLSDRFGRRPILLISLFGAGIDYLFMAYAPTMWMLYIGRVISGLTGASMTVASSYMADVSTDENRSANFGMIGAAWGIGFILGPSLGGLLGSYGPMAPFLAAAFLNILNFLFGLFVLPESLPPEMRRKVEFSKLNPLASVFHVLKPSPILILVYVYFFVFLAGQVHPVNWTLYTQTKFGWSAREVGLSLSFTGVVIASAQVFLTRILIPKLGERRSLTFGLIINAISFALFGLATQGWMMYPILLFFGLSGVTMPALQSILAKHIPANRQGEVQGSLVSLGSLSCILAPLFYTYLFVQFTKPDVELHFPGAAYLGASAICVLTLSMWLIARSRETQRPST